MRFLLLSVTAGVLANVVNAAAIATVKNGTYQGVFLENFQQDAFLGIKYAEAPRYQPPVSLNESFSEVRQAVNYSLSCPGTLSFSQGFEFSEDCLTLNIVRPSSVQANSRVASIVWIYGGGYQGGTAADPTYNVSFLVQNSHEPIIAVSLNYRVGGLGFLASTELLNAGVVNIGLKDQRKALDWLQENIAAFGGDPDKVTIWGESAGANSVGHHLNAHGASEKKPPFRAAIMESGGSSALPVYNSSAYDSQYAKVLQLTNCTDLACLRSAPFDTLFEVLIQGWWQPVVDQDFIRESPTAAINSGHFYDVPILIGTNTDEGTFFGPRGLNTTDQLRTFLATPTNGLLRNVYNFSSPQLDRLLELYPDDPAMGCPFGSLLSFEDQGVQFKRGAAIYTDLVIAATRRLMSQKFSTVFSYRFNINPWNGVENRTATIQPVFVTHYVEIPFVFVNPLQTATWLGPYNDYFFRAQDMSSRWTQFALHLSPGQDWKEYHHGSGTNMVFNLDNVFEEPDIWREQQISYINSIAPSIAK